MIEARLIHYSELPLTNLRSKTQSEEPNMKPEGLWFSVESSWKEWCEGEDFALHRLGVETEIKIVDSQRILWLPTSELIIRFTNEFQKEPSWKARTHLISTKYNGLPDEKDTMYIDWKTVAERYSGIIISPYQWGCRLNETCRWYYCWDCASGCIWDASIIGELE